MHSQSLHATGILHVCHVYVCDYDFVIICFLVLILQMQGSLELTTTVCTGNLQCVIWSNLIFLSYISQKQLLADYCEKL